MHIYTAVNIVIINVCKTVLFRIAWERWTNAGPSIYIIAHAALAKRVYCSFFVFDFQENPLCMCDACITSSGR